MLVQCQQCGAPLDVPPNVTHVKCTYCDVTNRVRSLKTISPMTPQGWAPPPQWQPPPQFHMPRPLAYHAQPVVRAPRSAGCGVVIAAVVMVLVMGGAAFVMMAAGRGGTSFAAMSTSWDGTSPLYCGDVTTLNFDNVTANLQGQDAITLSGNCDLVLSNSRIFAGNGIIANGNNTVTLRNVTIVASGTGIVAGGNSEFDIWQSTITASGVGIEGRLNSDVTMHGGVLTGFPQPYTTFRNSQVLLVDGATSTSAPFQF